MIPYSVYEAALAAELLPAMGCTEPIALAYAAAICAKRLGGYPERIELDVSRNIVKNVKSVVVPNTGGLTGLEAAAVAGFVAAKPKRPSKCSPRSRPKSATASANLFRRRPSKCVSRTNPTSSSSA